MRLKFGYKKITHYVISVLFLLAVSIATGMGIGNGKIIQEQKQQASQIVDSVSSLSHVAVSSDLYNVVSIVDGDTIKVDIDGTTTTIRLIGIDTPEVVDPRKPVQCFGKEASNKEKELLRGKRVMLISDETQGDVDKYKRLLRYIALEDGTIVNEYMIREGYAYEYTYQIPYVHQKAYKDAERYARENKKGLWADGVCGDNLF